ncbi:MAG: formylglycine-generating enzyme family protein, partial [Bradymonadaceae bacterium]
MGSPAREIGRVDGEDQHVVELSRAYFMQRTEVTQGDWERLMGFNPSYFHDCGANCPVESISWFEALAYANALSTESGLEPCYELSHCTGQPGRNYQCPVPMELDLDCSGYRLPTEAEWEHAYRAGSSTAYHNGDVELHRTCEQPLIDEIAVFCGNCSIDREITYDCSQDGARPQMPTDCGTHPVATKEPNGWGLYDMSGNVYEFVWDHQADYPVGFRLDPTGGEDGTLIMIRGSGFCGHMARLRAADRKSTTQVQKDFGIGFRLVRSIVGEERGLDACPSVDEFTNACGGLSTLQPGMGAPCGPCGVDRMECSNPDETLCNGWTDDCNFGTPCQSDSECIHGHCSNSHCAPEEFVHIPPGEFLMGSPLSELSRVDNEIQHPVTITRPFLMQQTETTQAFWTLIMGSNPSQFQFCGADCPVESINWFEAVAFANTLSEIQGLRPCYDLSACTGVAGVS